MNRSHSVAVVLLLISACSARSPVPPSNAATFDLSQTPVIDLTHAYDADTVYWPTSPSRFELRVLHRGPTDGGYWYEANVLCTPEHGGTHMDAPAHFAKDHWSADQVPIERFIGPAIVIDIRSQAAADPDYRLTRADVEHWETDHGRVGAGTVVLLRTGWSERWPNVKSYLGDDSPGDASHLHFPSFGEDAARFLIVDRGVHAIGVDTASIDYGASRDFPVHRLAGAADVLGFENLTGLDRLPATGAWVVALPMKIARGSGAPLRAIALLPK